MYHFWHVVNADSKNCIHSVRMWPFKLVVFIVIKLAYPNFFQARSIMMESIFDSMHNAVETLVMILPLTQPFRSKQRKLYIFLCQLIYKIIFMVFESCSWLGFDTFWHLFWVMCRDNVNSWYLTQFIIMKWFTFYIFELFLSYRLCCCLAHSPPLLKRWHHAQRAF